MVQTSEAGPLLSVHDLAVTFGGVLAVDGLTFSMPPRLIVSVIGPNGAGKTTVLNAISGFARGRGSICLRAVELSVLPSHRRASLGIGRTFQNLQLFSSLSLIDNVLVGQHASSTTPFRSGQSQDRHQSGILGARRRAFDLLQDLGIEEYAEQRAADLPFGVQKLAGVARALASGPSLLLLDEPAAGLTQSEALQMGKVLQRLRADLDVTMLLVEHNMRLVMGISDRIIVLDRGRKLTEGAPEEVRADTRVIEAYLGSTTGASTVQLNWNGRAGDS